MSVDKNYVLKVGKGEGEKFRMTFGMSEAKVTPRNASLTLKQFAKRLARQLKIRNGKIEIHSINFTSLKGE